MATKSARVIELEEAIAPAVATLGESDGTRIGASEAIDSARETLADGYRVGFENAVKEYIGDSEDEEDED